MALAILAFAESEKVYKKYKYLKNESDHLHDVYTIVNFFWYYCRGTSPYFLFPAISCEVLQLFQFFHH